MKFSKESIRETVKMTRLWRPLFERLYERRFARDAAGEFRGVFSNFGQANLSAPKTKPTGFNTQEYAKEFSNRRGKIFSFDYPVLFWLEKLLHENCVVFDYGGHLGTHFYAYAKYLAYPRGMRWIVCDLPLITRAGNDLAMKMNAQGLSFTNDFDSAASSNILIAAGSLQYIEAPSLSVSLRNLARLPAHLLLNKLPLYDGPKFVTLQNGGPSFHPQYIFNREEFIADLEAVGYHLKDQWSVQTHSGYIPFHPARSFPYHSGLYLSLD